MGCTPSARAAWSKGRALPGVRRGESPRPPCLSALGKEVGNAVDVKGVDVHHQAEGDLCFLPQPLHQGKHFLQPGVVGQRRGLARWITGPSAMGSEKGTPNSMMSAPFCSMASTSCSVVSRSGSPGGDEGNQRLPSLGGAFFKAQINSILHGYSLLCTSQWNTRPCLPGRRG